VSDDATSVILEIEKAKSIYLCLHNALLPCRTPGRGLIFIDILRLSFRSRYQLAMRTLTPPAASRIAIAADSALSQLLSLVLPHHTLFTLPSVWSHLKIIHNIKVSLALKKGGLGLRTWTSLRHITHFSSWAEAGPRILLLMTSLDFSLPASILHDIGDSVAAVMLRTALPCKIDSKILLPFGFLVRPSNALNYSICLLNNWMTTTQHLAPPYRMTLLSTPNSLDPACLTCAFPLTLQLFLEPIFTNVMNLFLRTPLLSIR
jgi:hypothetical protein